MARRETRRQLRSTAILVAFLAYAALGACPNFCPLDICGFEMATVRDCSSFAILGTVPTVTLNDACAESVLDLLCAFFAAQDRINRAQECATSGAAGLGFCKRDCETLNSCLLIPYFQCDSPAYVSPDGVCTEPLPPSEYQRGGGGSNVTVSYTRSCPKMNSKQDPELLKLAELGGLANLDRTKYPDFPELRLVERDVPLSTLFPEECREFNLLEPEDTTWGIALLVLTLYVLVCSALFWWRRDHSPIRVRPVYQVHSPAGSPGALSL